MGQVRGYTTRTGKRVGGYTRSGARLRTNVALDTAIRQMARNSWGGGAAFGASPGSYRNHLDSEADIAKSSKARKRITRADVAHQARLARYGHSPLRKVEFLVLNAERRRRSRGGSLVGLRRSPAASAASRVR